MPTFDVYLSCKKHIKEVKKFLDQFFEEEKGRYNHQGWITFKIPKNNFKINLTASEEVPLTKNVMFEIVCDTKQQLRNYAKKHKCEIKDFIATETSKNYSYNYIEVFGPKNICNIEICYPEEI